MKYLKTEGMGMDSALSTQLLAVVHRTGEKNRHANLFKILLRSVLFFSDRSRDQGLRDGMSAGGSLHALLSLRGGRQSA